MATRRSLTKEEKGWADNLKKIWQEKKNVLGFSSQEELSLAIGWSQSAAGLYLRGEIPLNTNAKFQFCKHLKCSILDIDPKFPIEGMVFDDAEIKFLEAYRQLSESGKRMVQAAIDLAEEKTTK